MAVLQPSEPQHLTFDGKLNFSSPRYNGGSRISEYAVIIWVWCGSADNITALISTGRQF